MIRRAFHPRRWQRVCHRLALWAAIAQRGQRGPAHRHPHGHAADLSYTIFDSINGAEHALGIDLDGIDGPGAAGPVTVVFGNVDGGTPDFAIVLLNAYGVTATAFLF